MNLALRNVSVYCTAFKRALVGIASYPGRSLQTFSQSSLGLMCPDPTQVEFVSLKLGLSRFCLTVLKQNHVKFDFLQSCETTKFGTNLVQKIPSYVSPGTVLLLIGYMIGFEAARTASDACFRRIEMHNT